MEGDSEKNSGRGSRMTFCQRRKGTRECRGSGGICDWGAEGGSVDLSFDRMQAREAHGMSRKGTNQVLLSRGWLVIRPAHKPINIGYV